MAEILLRPAVPADRARIDEIVRTAYEIYIPRIGKPPAPMLADYGALIAAGRVVVADVAGRVAGAVVFWREADHVYLDMVAIDPAARRSGLGRRLIAHVEDAARHLGLLEVRLYTNVRMTENLTLYPHLGYLETHRAHHEGYDRVFFAKPLAADR